MLDRGEFQRWWAAAESARQSALLQAGSDQHHWACFLAEQAAQLAMKGLLHGIGAGGWGHDLVVLGTRLEETTGEPLPAGTAGALQRLARHYIPTRYPDAHPSGPPGAYFGPQDVRQALDDLGVVLGQVEDVWLRLGGPPPGGAT